MNRRLFFDKCAAFVAGCALATKVGLVEKFIEIKEELVYTMIISSETWDKVVRVGPPPKDLMIDIVNSGNYMIETIPYKQFLKESGIKL